jgi:predicted nucleic acid-binding protein
LIRYFDASALAKRYFREPETDDVNRYLAEATSCTSRLSEVEVSSALARRVREGRLAAEQRAAALAGLRADLAWLHVVEIVPTLVAATHDLLSRHSLRAPDALHLASALALRERLQDDVEFVGYDERLQLAAANAGLPVRP